VLLLLAIPGSTYLYQGEELGLFEVADLPPEALQDPIWIRDGGARKGRDGCRVPIPWTSEGRSFGFGSAGSHLPMPTSFGLLAVDQQDNAPDSTLELYRAALRMRQVLQTGENLTWHDASDQVAWFSRDNGWNNFTNFGHAPEPLPPGEFLLSSAGLLMGEVPGETTVWFRS
jgi:alpha-glucosidase